MIAHQMICGGWNPTVLGSALRGWYKADVGWGGAGTTWADQSGIGNTLTLTGTSAGSVVNGITSIRFNGSTDKANKTSFSLGATGGISLFCAVKGISAGTSDPVILSYGDNSTELHELRMNTAGSGTAECGDFAAVATGTTNLVGAWHRAGITDVLASSEFLYVSGAQEASQGGGNATTSHEFCVGQRTGAGGIPANVDLGEILVIEGVVSATDRTNIDNYLRRRFGL